VASRDFGRLNGKQKFLPKFCFEWVQRSSTAVPDDSGVFYDDSTGVGLVHRRLSILDLSPAGHQPMASHSGRYLIIFNGEVYNFEEIRKELGPAHAWRGHSDTEVMLEAFERWGVEGAVQRFCRDVCFCSLGP